MIYVVHVQPLGEAKSWRWFRSHRAAAEYFDKFLWTYTRGLSAVLFSKRGTKRQLLRRIRWDR